MFTILTKILYFPFKYGTVVMMCNWFFFTFEQFKQDTTNFYNSDMQWLSMPAYESHIDTGAI